MLKLSSKIGPRILASFLRASFYSSLFAGFALLAACGGSYGGGNGNGGGGGPQYGAPVIATTAPPDGTVNSAYSFTFMVASGGKSPFTWSETGALPAGLALGSGGKLSGTPTASGSFPITVKVQDSASQTATQDFTIIIASGFSTTGSMSTPRAYHTATLLNDGTVLVTGGLDASSNVLSSAEIYDPASGTFALTAGPLNTPRAGHTATLLNDGTVLIAGGADTSAEIYNPANKTFTTLAASMTIARDQHTASLLNDGTVLLAGGIENSGAYIDTAEIYDPVAQTFTATAGSMITARSLHTSTTLKDGRVLITGGQISAGSGQFTSSAAAELYDPSAKTFSSVPHMADARFEHTATILPSGRVLIAGGEDPNFDALSSTEIFDSSTNSFQSAGNMSEMSKFRAGHTATLLTGTEVLLAGGASFEQVTCGNNCVTLAAITTGTAEIFDPSQGNLGIVATLQTARYFHTATKLQNGGVLIVGGIEAHTVKTGRGDIPSTTVLSSAELFQ